MPTRAAKALATTCQRAETLQADGYKFTRRPGTSIWDCQKPATINKRTGEIIEHDPYVVDLRQDDGVCSCEGFRYYGHCKHERACRAAVCEALELLLGKDGAK
jgi:hypothetical protein